MAARLVEVCRSGESHEDIYASATVYSLLAKEMLVQFWTRNGVDSWPRVGQRHDAESETWPGASCLKMDLPYIPHPLRPASVGVDWLYCVWAKCDLSSESGFVSTWDLASFLSSFMRAEPRGSLCFLCPHRTTGEAWQKRLFLCGWVGGEGYFGHHPCLLLGSLSASLPGFPQ